MPVSGATVTGIKEVTINLELLEEIVLDALGEALDEHMTDVLLDAQANYVPVDTGALRSSAFKDKLKKTKNTVKVTGGFGQDSIKNPKTGNPTSDYAWIQHETNPNGGRKYLTRPTNKLMIHMEQRITFTVQKQMDLLMRPL